MIISNSNLAALRTTFELRFREAYAEKAAWSDQLATTIPSTNATNTYAWMANAMRLRRWIGPRQAIAMREHAYVLANEPFEGTFQVPREHILDDSLGIYSSAIVPQIAAATKKHPDQQLIEKVFVANPACFDGTAFWSGAHPTFAPAGVAQTYDNDFTLALGPTLEDAIDTLTLIESAMMTIPGENGIILDTMLDTLIVPPQLKTMAFRLTTATQVNNDGPANPYAGKLKAIVVNELGYAPSTFYLADLNGSLKPLIWQSRSKPILRSFDSGTDYESFRNNTFEWGVDGDDGGPYRGNAGVSMPFLCARSVGA